MNRQDAKTPREEPDEATDSIAANVVDSAFRVDSELGPGLLENVYEICLAHELEARGHHVERQRNVPIEYLGMCLESGLRLDLLVDGMPIVEIRAIEAPLPVHKAQVITYLKLTRLPVGLLIDFNVPLIKDGIKRIISSPLASSRLGGSIP